jgi:hypothetical protein
MPKKSAVVPFPQPQLSLIDPGFTEFQRMFEHMTFQEAETRMIEAAFDVFNRCEATSNPIERDGLVKGHCVAVRLLAQRVDPQRLAGLLPFQNAIMSDLARQTWSMVPLAAW